MGHPCYIMNLILSPWDVLSLGTFCPLGRFVPWDILSLGTFGPLGSFVLWDILSLGRYVPGTLCPLGRFIPGTFCPSDVLSLGRFVPGTFCLGTFCIPTPHLHLKSSKVHRQGRLKMWWSNHIPPSPYRLTGAPEKSFDLYEGFKKCFRKNHLNWQIC